MKYYEIGEALQDQFKQNEIYIQINFDLLSKILSDNPRMLTPNCLDEPIYDDEGLEIDQDLDNHITLKLKRLSKKSDKYECYVVDWKPDEISK